MSKKVKYIIGAILISIGVSIFYNKVYVVKTTFETLSPTIGDLTVKVFGIGNVSAKDIYLINAQTGGKIVSILSDEGKWVKKGDLLVTIDPVDMPEALEEMKLSVKKAKSELNALQKESETLNAQKKLAQTTFTRYENLLKNDFVSQFEYDKVKVDLDTLTAQLEAANARIKSSKIEVLRTQKSVDSTITKLSRFNIYSQIDGYVIAKEAQEAQSVTSSTPILKIVDEKTVWVKAYIDERISSNIKVGQKAHIVLRSQNETIFEAKVKRIVAQSDIVTQEREVNITFDELPIPFYINEQARVTIDVKTLKNALKVPLNTLVFKDKKEGVWVLKNSKAYFKPLIIEAKSDTHMAIKEGINKDDIVIIPNINKKSLSEGMRIHR